MAEVSSISARIREIRGAFRLSTIKCQKKWWKNVVFVCEPRAREQSRAPTPISFHTQQNSAPAAVTLISYTMAPLLDIITNYSNNLLLPPKPQDNCKLTLNEFICQLPQTLTDGQNLEVDVLELFRWVDGFSHGGVKRRPHYHYSENSKCYLF